MLRLRLEIVRSEKSFRDNSRIGASEERILSGLCQHLLSATVADLDDVGRDFTLSQAHHRLLGRQIDRFVSTIPIHLIHGSLSLIEPLP